MCGARPCILWLGRQSRRGVQGGTHVPGLSRATFSIQRTSCVVKGVEQSPPVTKSVQRLLELFSDTGRRANRAGQRERLTPSSANPDGPSAASPHRVKSVHELLECDVAGAFAFAANGMARNEVRPAGVMKLDDLELSEQRRTGCTRQRRGWCGSKA